MSFRTNLLRVMMVTTLLLLTGALHVCAGAGAQKLVTLQGKDVPLAEAIAKIKQQTGLLFIYSDKDIVRARPITVDLKNAEVARALETIFKDQPLTFELQENTVFVVLRPAPEAPPATGPPPPADIHGRVTDSLGNPLAGASVTVKGAKTGVETDAKGEFELKGVGNNAVLIISFTGFRAQEYKVNGNKPFAVVLNRLNSPLDEVQIIAYGQTTERLSVGDVTTVKAEEIEKQPVQNLLQALEGRVPGLFVTQSTGMPGSAFTVQIRGQNSIANGNDPFYVIDGVPYSSELIPGTGLNPGGGNPLDFINPGDIESVSVLKDADATAIYGSRAANGAILDHHEKGESRKASWFNLNASQGIGQAPLRAKWLNTSQYLQMRNGAYSQDGLLPDPGSAPDLLVWDTTRYTNWQKTLVGKQIQPIIPILPAICQEVLRIPNICLAPITIGKRPCFQIPARIRRWPCMST